jgi:hypothetical protein
MPKTSANEVSITSCTSPARDRIPALKAEVAATQAKLERLRASLAARQQKLNRLLAEDAMNGAAAAVRRYER